MENLYLEYGRASVNKHDESLCGDSVSIVRRGERMTAVLSDGLGSGVKANILSTLTATILSTLMSRRLPVDECIETVATTLPMCKQRRLAYSTFTLLQLEEEQVHLVQYDNPSAILLRGGKNRPYSSSVRFIGEKEIHESDILLQENDIIVMMSDGVTNAGLGKLMPNGWPREEVIEFLEREYTPDMSPQYLAARLVDAGVSLCLDSPDDDITALVFKVRQRQMVNVMIGPPFRPEDDEKILRVFFSKEGSHIICGGTTAQVVSRYLGRPVSPVLESGTPEVPAIARMEGVDLVTEGIITLQAVVELAEQYAVNNLLSLRVNRGTDGVSLLARYLFEEATDVNLFYGQAVNHAHDGLSIDFGLKSDLIKRLSRALGDMGKRVKISQC